ncbi:hypothetical protein LEMLEM_LOCUS4221 [Lemmus lemmus]
MSLCIITIIPKIIITNTTIIITTFTKMSWAQDAGERDPQTQTLLLSGRRSRHFLAGRAARTGCDPAASAAARRALKPPAPPAPLFQPDPPSPALQQLREPRSSRPLCSVEVRSEAPCLGLEGTMSSSKPGLGNSRSVPFLLGFPPLPLALKSLEPDAFGCHHKPKVIYTVDPERRSFG